MLSYKVSVTTSGDDVIEIDEVMGHVIGNGALKIQVADGTELIYNNFKFFQTLLTDDEKEQFRTMIQDKEESALARIAEQEEANGEKKDNVVSLDS